MSLSSADCKTVDRPECSQSQVSLELFRSLAKIGSPTEVDRPLPDRPEQMLINHDPALHRDSEAVLPENEDAENWIKGYQERILQRRGLLKQRLLLAISQFELLSSSMTSTRISNELSTLKKGMILDPALYQKMQVLCSEIDVAVRPDIGLLEKRFDSTLQITKFKNLVEASSDQQLSGMVSFYQNIANATFPICEQIRIEKLWKQDSPIATTSYSAWYRDLSGTWSAPVPKPDEKAVAPDFVGMGDVFNKSTTTSIEPFLTQEKIDTDGTKESNLICSDASDCVRMLLKSMVDLYAVSAWSDALMPMNEWIQSPNLANPWAADTACKVYDPGFATKQAMIGLFSDLVSTTITGFAPIPAYLAASPNPRQVKAFALDPKGDEVYLKPIKKGPVVDFTVGIDLGPWLGIPCAFMVSPTSARPAINGFYAIAGIQGQLCTGKDNNKLIVHDASSMNNEKNVFTGCAMCYLNPLSVATGVAAIASYAVPGLRVAVSAIFSGVHLAKRLSNPIDVPHRFQVNIDEVSNTFHKYSFIPKRCVRRLSKGKSCQHVSFTHDERKTHK